MSSYSTSYDEDIAMMGMTNLSWPHRTAATARSRTKMVLMKVLENLEHRIASKAPENATSWKHAKLEFLLSNTDPALSLKDGLAQINVEQESAP